MQPQLMHVLTSLLLVGAFGALHFPNRTVLSGFPVIDPADRDSKPLSYFKGGKTLREQGFHLFKLLLLVDLLSSMVVFRISLRGLLPVI